MTSARARARARSDASQRSGKPPKRAVGFRGKLESTVPTRGHIEAVKKLFDQIPADELIAALESSDDERSFRLLALIRDRARQKQRVGMALLIREAGLNVTDTLKLITSMHRADADLRVARRLPGIMERMAIESEPHFDPCPRCSSGSDDDDVAAAVADKLTGAPRKCPRCHDRRFVLVKADNDVRKMVLEGAGVLGNKAPLIDARSVHLHAGAPDMTDWSRGSDDAFERGVPRRLAAADIVDADEATD